MWTDKESMQYFLDLQDKTNPTISIEVGAFDADFSVEISKKNIPTYAFEAFPEIHNNFKESLSHINYINLAVTDYDGYCDFYFIRDNLETYLDQGFFSIKIGGYVSEKNKTTISVPCTFLDSYFKDLHDERIVLWIDCEGANREVLTGASKILSMVDSIYIEVEKTQIWKDIWVRDDVINYLEGLGFILIKEYYAYSKQTNCIFVKKHLSHLV